MKIRSVVWMLESLVAFGSFEVMAPALAEHATSPIVTKTELRQPAKSHGQNLLFLGDEKAYLQRVDSLRNEHGLFLDRRSDRSIVSTAATGLGVLALAEGSTRGLRDREEVLKIARTSFEQTVVNNPPKNRGWLSHFTDPTGMPKPTSEVSTIDTAIFYSGLLQASRLLEDRELENVVLNSLQSIDKAFVMRDNVFLHGFYWSEIGEQSEGSPHFISHRWNDSSEGVILYHLFGLPFPMQIQRTDYPLFAYAYPLCFYDDPIYDRFLQEAIEGQIKQFGYWGVTSTDGPQGYVTLDRNVISPVLIGSIASKYSKYLESLKSINIKEAVGSMHVGSGWIGTDDLTIDLTSAYVLFSRWTRQEVIPATPPSHSSDQAKPADAVEATAS